MEPVRVEGLAEIRRSLRRMDKDIRKEVRKVDKEVAVEDVLPNVQQEVPQRTGRLLRSTKGGADSQGGYVQSGAARAPYATPIHWGWPRRNIEPNQFIQRGLQQVDGGIGERYLQRVSEVIERMGLEVE